MTSLDTAVPHHVVIEPFQKRVGDVQLRLGDKITALAGSMRFVYTMWRCSPHGCLRWREVRGRP
jgi:hypothetical protein